MRWSITMLGKVFFATLRLTQKQYDPCQLIKNLYL